MSGGCNVLLPSFDPEQVAATLAQESLAMARALGEQRLIAILLVVVGVYRQFSRGEDEAAMAREEELHALAKQAGSPLYDVSTDDDLVRALVRIVVSRRRRRQ